MKHLAFYTLRSVTTFLFASQIPNVVSFCLSFFVIVVSFIVLFALVCLGLSCSLIMILVKSWLGAEANVQLYCHLKHVGIIK